MVELALVLEIVRNLTTMTLLMLQSASEAQREVLLDRHLTMTKPFYDLIAKLTHRLPDPPAGAAVVVPMPMRPPVLPPPPVAVPLPKA